MFKKAYTFIAFLVIAFLAFSVVRIPSLSQAFAEESTDSATVAPSPTASPTPTATTTSEESQIAAYLYTDQADYSPTQTAIIFGNNFKPNETITLEITSDNLDVKVDVTTDSSGNFAYSYQLDGTYRPLYNIVAKDSTGVVLATTSFTDSAGPSASPNQCKNGKVGGTPESCAGANWVTGNVNGHKAHWQEGDMLSYRVILSNIPAGATGTYTFSYDVTKAKKHAIDYLGDFDGTETTSLTPSSTNANHNDPCGDVFPCDPTHPDGTVDVPVMGTAVTETNLNPFPTTCGSNTWNTLSSKTAGKIKAWNATLSNFQYVSPQNAGSGDCTTTVSVDFDSAAGGDIVIAFGGHVATRADWGVGNSAVAIHGSPYHVHQVALSVNGTDKNVGSQDLQLATSAIVTPSSIDIVKYTVGGDDTFGYTTTGNGLSSFNITTNNNTGGKDFANLTPGSNGGSRSITETSITGWDLTGLGCDSTQRDNQDNPLSTFSVNPSTGVVTVSNLVENDLVTCTYTNTKKGHLIVQKTTDPADPTEFSILASGDGTITGGGAGTVTDASDKNYEVTPGTYSVSETVPTGWQKTGDTCQDVVVGAGETKYCLLTNAKDAHLIVIKHVVNDNGGSSSASDFTMTIHNVTATGGNSFAGAESPGTDKSLTSVGSYSVTETGPAGYSSSSSADCSGTIAFGETKTCTITNNDVQPKLTVTKVVINHGGSKVVSDFPLFVDTTGVISGVQNGFNAGTYTVSETGDPNYTGTISGDCNSQTGSVTLAAGDDKTCTITNEELPATIVVHKVVVNHGLTNDATHFAPYKVGDTIVTLDSATTIDSGAYLVSEASDPDYTATFTAGDCDSSGSVIVTPGSVNSCTITNEEKPATLTLVKTVTNDNGGDKHVSDFVLKIDGSPVTSGESNTLNSGVHSASEVNLPGYAASSWGGNCAIDGSVTLNPGENKTCTITNDDIAPTLTLNKVVVNDNGGTAHESEWTLAANGGEVAGLLSGPGAEGSTDVVSGAGFKAGTYELSESAGPAGYTPSSWSCVKNGSDPVVGNSITLDLGDNATCTITNTAQPAHLTVNKVIITPFFLEKDPGKFNLLVDEATKAANIEDVHTRNPDNSISDEVDGGTDPITLNAGSYSISEQSTGKDISKYQYEISCKDSDNKTVDVSPDIAHFPWAINLTNGANVTCTITNSPPGSAQGIGQLTVIKHTIDGNDTFHYSGTTTVPGTISPFGDINPFSFSATTTNGTNGIGLGDDEFSFDGTSILAFPDFPASVTLTEDDPPSGWVFNSIGCVAKKLNGADGDSTFTYDGQTAHINFIDEENVTCTYTNTKLGQIHGIKFEDTNGNGVKDNGEPGLNNWEINLAGPDDSHLTTHTDSSGNYSFTDLAAGTYNVTETQQGGWTQTTTQPDSIDLNGQEVNDVNFGNFKNINISGYKWHDVDGSQQKDNGEVNLAGWTIFIDFNNNGVLDTGEPTQVTTTGGYTFVNVGPPGSYQVCEVQQAGWSQTSGGCQPININQSGQNITNINFGNMSEREGTIGFWRNWNRHNKYPQGSINNWLAAIDTESAWLKPAGYTTFTTTDMVKLINDGTKDCNNATNKDQCAKNKFLMQYMVTRLNVASGRKSFPTNYNLSSFTSILNFLGVSTPYTSVNLGNLKDKVEAKAALSLSRNNFLQMASVFDFINNQGI